MDVWNQMIILLFSMVTSHLTYTSAEVLTESRCYTDGVVPLQCPSGSLIRVFNITYGLSEDDTCSHTEGDCALTERTSFGCNGLNRCTISITEETKYFLPLPRCNQIGNYMQVKYECVPETQIANICEDSRSDLEATEGYLSSPQFSRGYYSAVERCEFLVVGVNIKIQLITVNLTDSQDCLKLENAFSSKTFCGGSGVVENYDTPMIPSEELTIKFNTGYSGHHGGIWLHYTVTPIPVHVVKTTTTKPTTTTTQRPTTSTDKLLTTTSKIQTTTNLPDIPQSWTNRIAVRNKNHQIMVYNNVSTGSVSMETVVTILSLVFGILGVIVISLFLLYFLKRFKDYKRKKDRRRSDSSGLQHVIWHNAQNECLSSILEKNTNQTEQGYTNNMSDNDRNNAAVSKYKLENSFC